MLILHLSGYRIIIALGHRNVTVWRVSLNRLQFKIRLLLITSLLLPCLLHGACAPDSDFDKSLHAIARPYFFDTVQWQLSNIFEGAPLDRGVDTADQKKLVINYFNTAEQIESLQTMIELINSGDRHGDVETLRIQLDKLQQHNMALMETVETIIEEQIREILEQEGINNPIEKYINRIKYY